MSCRRARHPGAVGVCGAGQPAEAEPRVLGSAPELRGLAGERGVSLTASWLKPAGLPALPVQGASGRFAAWPDPTRAPGPRVDGGRGDAPSKAKRAEP